MGRKRLVSPEFFRHGELFDAEAATGLPLRIAFIGLWCEADKRGIFRWKPRALKLTVLPYDEVNFAAVLDALVQHGFVRRYEVDGNEYGFIPSFSRWQTFHRMERPSDDPAPPKSVSGKDDLLDGKQPSGWIPREVREAVLARDDHKCRRCGATDNLTMDHVVPFSHGGTNDACNLQTLCRSCNSKKGARTSVTHESSLQECARSESAPITVAVAVATTGTGTGTGSTASAPSGAGPARNPNPPPAAPAVSDPPVGRRGGGTWMTPLAAAWEAEQGEGSFPFARAAKALKPLVSAHGAPEVAKRLGYWLRTHRRKGELKFLDLSCARFAATWAEWNPDAPAFPGEDDHAA